MRNELARAAVSVPIATLLGLSLTSGRARRPGAGLLAGLLTLLALVVYLDSWRTWLVVAIAGVGAASMPSRKHHRASWTVAAAWATAVAVLATALATVVLDETATQRTLESVARRGDVVFVVAGGLAAVFVGGEIIARMMHPLATRTSRTAPGMENAGRYIGWLERTLLYGLVLAGAPDAAALVVAGKSIARFPSFNDEAFAEYYLIGSLLSLAIAAGAAIAVRALLGLTPLPAMRA